MKLARIAVAAGWFVASDAMAQPPGDQDRGPPPQAPEPNWAPPQPVEQPPSTPPSSTASPATAAPATPAAAPPQESTVEQEEQPSEMTIYGFAMLDIGYDFGKIGDPDWQDVLRPTKLPAFTDEFGKGGRTFEAVKQSRFGVKAKTPTPAGEIDTKFEFELFGTGVDAGQTTFRLRHFYGEWHNILGGQTWSPFMDPDVFPDSIEYWGPPGMVFFRNVQLAYTPWREGDSYITVAAERPGASADSASIDSERFDLTNVVPRFPAPDISAAAKWAGPWGHLKLAAIFRYIKWDDLQPTPVIEGHVYGWGVNVSSNLKLGPTVLKLQAVYGHAIENYMNDAGVDVAPDPPAGNPGTITGVGLPVLGIVAFIDVAWNKYLSSTAGYSCTWIDNSSGQAPDAFHFGQYALGNLLFHPTKSLMFGPELQWGRRSNNSDGFSTNDYRLQFSIKYSFSHTVGGKK